MLINLLEPVLYVIESLLVRAIVHQDDSHRALVIRLRYCAETLLSSGVPDLELDSFFVDIDLFDLEIDTYNMCVMSTDYYQWWACD